jgi:hypothetical protein
MTMKRSWIAVFAILACLSFAWATGAGRPYPATAGGVIDPTCTSSLPCIEYDNNGTGPGIRGISVSGNGLAGATKNHSTSSVNGRAGLIGNDTGTGSFNSGVNGLSVNGTGVSGASTSYVGVYGKSGGYIGVFGTGPTYGVAGSSVSGVGVYGSSTTGAANGIGVLAVSSNFIGEEVSGGGRVAGASNYPALSINGNGLSADLLDACNSLGPNPCQTTTGLPVAQFELDDVGSVYITGRIHTAGSCSSGCATSQSAGEKRVRLFTPQESLPTVEDFGQAQLVGGRTYVRIDPAFANIMEKSAAYLVFITPKGDNRGLYVTNESATGFEVRESQGGRSTLAFDYRIVARPFGEHPVRLQMITVSRPGRSLPQPRVR